MFAGETVVTIDEAGVHGTKGESRSDIGWDATTDFVETPEALVIRQGRRTIALIPTRAFTDGAARAAFLDVLREHLPTGDLRHPTTPRAG